MEKNSQLVKGDILMAMVYNGDALMLQEFNKNIVFVFPEEGSNLWLDNLVIMESSPKKDLARAFINFLNEPENAARLAERIFQARSLTKSALQKNPTAHGPSVQQFSPDADC
ncbi:MAG: extracellular solute-binding protein [Proteobacteria bacterium]|nr:extracellular solute-binding protein [Pseudomonadota bacterium]